MAHHQDRWGIWLPSHNHSSALHAVKMGGMHSFLLGLVLVIQAVLQFTTAPGVALVLMMIGFAMMCLALLVRAGRWQIGPIPVAISFFAIAANLWLWIQGVPTIANLATVAMSLIYLVLAIFALRGWVWLLRHPPAT